MNTHERQTITRAELSIMLGVSVETLTDCEKSLKLDEAKIAPTKRTIRYALPVLRRMEWFRKLESR